MNRLADHEKDVFSHLDKKVRKCELYRNKAFRELYENFIDREDTCFGKAPADFEFLPDNTLEFPYIKGDEYKSSYLYEQVRKEEFQDDREDVFKHGLSIFVKEYPKCKIQIQRYNDGELHGQSTTIYREDKDGRENEGEFRIKIEQYLNGEIVESI